MCSPLLDKCYKMLKYAMLHTSDIDFLFVLRTVEVDPVLWTSIEQRGVLMPIAVRPIPKKRFWHRQRYEVIDGNLRLLHCLLLNIKTIPAAVLIEK